MKKAGGKKRVIRYLTDIDRTDEVDLLDFYREGLLKRNENRVSIVVLNRISRTRMMESLTSRMFKSFLKRGLFRLKAVRMDDQGLPGRLRAIWRSLIRGKWKKTGGTKIQQYHSENINNK
jgi:hypothetical protein